jgi:hypothetical protein
VGPVCGAPLYIKSESPVTAGPLLGGHGGTTCPGAPGIFSPLYPLYESLQSRPVFRIGVTGDFAGFPRVKQLVPSRAARQSCRPGSACRPARMSVTWLPVPIAKICPVPRPASAAGRACPTNADGPPRGSGIPIPSRLSGRGDGRFRRVSSVKQRVPSRVPTGPGRRTKGAASCRPVSVRGRKAPAYCVRGSLIRVPSRPTLDLGLWTLWVPIAAPARTETLAHRSASSIQPQKLDSAKISFSEFRVARTTRCPGRDATRGGSLNVGPRLQLSSCWSSLLLLRSRDNE